MKLKLRDFVIFLAGAEFFHTISHLFMPYLVEFPFQTNFIVLTTENNLHYTVINAVITIILIWWARKLKK